MNLLFKHEVRYMFRRGNHRADSFGVATRRASEVPLTLSYKQIRSGAAIVKADEGRYKWHFDYR